MAKRSSKKSNGGATGRTKPVAAKAGLSRNPKRRYGCGGKVK